MSRGSQGVNGQHSGDLELSLKLGISGSKSLRGGRPDPWAGDRGRQSRDVEAAGWGDSQLKGTAL